MSYTIVDMHGLVGVVALLGVLAGCGGANSTGPGSGNPKNSASCLPIDMQVGEEASYAFQQGSATVQLAVQVTERAVGVFKVRFIQNGLVVEANLPESCAGPEVWPKLTSEQMFGILGGRPLVESDTGSALPAVDSAPPADWTVSCDDIPQQLSVPAGTFSVTRCVMSPSTPVGGILRVTRYSAAPGTDTRPFSGVVKEVIEYSAGEANSDATLVEWNGI